MNKVAIVVMIVGVLITVGGIALIFTGDSFEENIEEGIIYEGADGKISCLLYTSPSPRDTG